MVTLADRADWGGAANSQNDLLAYLLDAYRNWEVPPTHVLLAGDGTNFFGGAGELDLPYFSDGKPDEQSWSISDNQFVCWSGAQNEDLWTPEALIGRLPAATATELDRMVKKVLGYEMTPYIDQPWVQKAVLMANGVQSCMHANIAVREIMTNNGYSRNDMVEAYVNWHNLQGNRYLDRGPINNKINAGVGFVNFRGYNDWGGYFDNQNEIAAYTNSWKMPVVTGMVCGTNDFNSRHLDGQSSIAETYLRGWNANGSVPRGGISCFGPTDLHTHTWFNNTMDAEFYDALFNRNVQTLGVAALVSKLSLVRNYPSRVQLGNGETVGYYFYSYTMLGDPSMQVWTRDPKVVDAIYDDQLPVGATYFESTVVDLNENPIEGAYLHLYKDANTRYGGYSDAEGLVKLFVPPLSAGNYLVTLTGANLVPVRNTLTVGKVARYSAVGAISFDDDNNGISEGNGNSEPNPDEILELTLPLENVGSANYGETEVTLQTDSPYISLVREMVTYPATATGQTKEGAEPFVIRIFPETPDNEDILFNLNVKEGGNQWFTTFVIKVIASRLQIVRTTWSDPLFPTTQRDLIVTLKNVGTHLTGDLTGTLYCSDRTIQIKQNNIQFGSLQVGASVANNNTPFKVYASDKSWQGTTASFGLLLKDAAGRRDSLVFTTSLGDIGVDSPQGPDEYGYYAIDSRDVQTDLAPEYEWVAGTTQLNLPDAFVAQNWNYYLSDHGSRIQIQLPFDLSYYGQKTRDITVGSNGWVAFGKSDNIAWNNQEIGSPLAPSGMICPFWTDLWDGRVYVKYDQANSRYIIEWRDVVNTEGGQPFSFLLMIYDPTVNVTKTGDSELVFHYKSLPLLQRDVPQEQASIGIASQDRKSHLSVTHSGVWDPATVLTGNVAPIAIKMTTGPFLQLGNITGTVLDATDDTPMRDAQVTLDGTGFISLTDANGMYTILDIPVDKYSVVAYSPGFNQTTKANVEVKLAENVRVDFSLTHPTFVINADSVKGYLNPDSTTVARFELSNNGNGPLDYTVSILTGGNPNAPLTHLMDIDVGNTVGDNKLHGVAFDGEHLQIAGTWETRTYPHNIYLFNREGELVRTNQQYSVDTTATAGFFALDWDGEYLYGAEKTMISVTDKEGNSVKTIATQERYDHCIAVVPGENKIITKFRSGAVYNVIDLNGNKITTYRDSDKYAGMERGMSWFPGDPDGYPLYVLQEVSIEQYDVLGTYIQLIKMNPTTGDFKLVQNIFLNEGDKPEDCYISNSWDKTRWTFFCVLSNPDGDRVALFDMGPNLQWITFDPPAGSVAPNDALPIDVTFNTANLPEGDYTTTLQITHNAVGAKFALPVLLTISSKPDPLKQVAVAPVAGEYRFFTPYPNPFNPSVTLQFYLPAGGETVLELYGLDGRLVDQLVSGRMEAGRHSLEFNGANLPSGVYLARLTSGNFTAVHKLILMR